MADIEVKGLTVEAFGTAMHSVLGGEKRDYPFGT